MELNAGRCVRAMTSDISAGGLQLRSRESLSQGDHGILEVLMPNNETIRTHATVIWLKQADNGEKKYGLRFDAIGPAELSTVFKVVMRPLNPAHTAYQQAS